MRVFKPSLQVDDYKSLLAKDPAVHKERLLALDNTPKQNVWPQPLEAVLDNVHAPMPDIVSVDAGNILLWERSFDLLSPYLSEFCEFLPVAWQGGSGHLLNVVGLTDRLDGENTEWCWHQKSAKRLFIEHFAFLEHAIPQALLFKIPENRFTNLTTDVVLDSGESLLTLIQKHELTGLALEEIWRSSEYAGIRPLRGIFYGELDGRGPKRVLVKVIGE